MRYVAISICVLASVAFFVGGGDSYGQSKPAAASQSQPASAQAMVESVEYGWWSSFKAGSMVKLKMDTQAPDRQGNIKDVVVEYTTIVKEVTAEKVINDNSTIMTVDGKSSPESTKHEEISAKIPADPSNDVKFLIRPTDLKEVGTEDVEFNGKKYPCKIVEFTRTAPDGSGKMATKAWLNSEIPGNVLKAVIVMEQKSNTITCNISMIEFKVEK